MRLTLLTLLVATACMIFTRKQPVTRIYAVSDGRLTLGAVPSENESGLQVYRLLLCKNLPTYNASMFTNNEMSQAALVDNIQREVVIVPDKLRRSFASKFRHHALVAFGIVAFTIAAITLPNRLPKASKTAKELGKGADVAHEKSLSLPTDEHAKVTASIRKELRKIEKASDRERTELEKALHQSLQTANEHRLNEVLASIRAIDAKVADELELGVFGGRVDADVLESLASRAEKLDASFAKQLQEAKLINKTFNNDGLLYFSTATKKIFDIKNKNVSLNSKLDKLQNIRKIPADYFDENEKIIIHQLHHAVSNLLSASLLRSLEVEKDLLLKLKNKEIGLDHISTTIKEEMQDITDKYVWNIDNIVGYHRSADDTVTEITQSTHISGITRYRELLRSYKMIGDLSFDELSLISKRDAYRNTMENIVKYAGDSSLERNISNRVAQLNLRISDTSETLLKNTADTIEVGHDVNLEIKMWSELAHVRDESTDHRQERLTLLRKEIGNFIQNVADRKKLIDTQDAVKNMSAESVARKKLILERHDKALKELIVAEEHLRKGRGEKFAILSKKAETNRKKLLIIGAGLGVTGAAVMAAIDKSIWGYGERQLGEHWSQIFNEKAEFGNATPVKDLNAVLGKLASVFGFHVNKSALSLAD